MMELLDQAQEIAGMRPLPDNAEQRIQSLMDKAKGDERYFIGQVFEALFVARSMA
jgi:hypothetical protein